MPFELVKKAGLLNQFKSPIGAKRNFQIHKDPHELAKESGKSNKWWKENAFMLFLWRKRRRMMWSKNKASSPRVAFCLCLKIVVKQGSFQKK